MCNILHTARAFGQMTILLWRSQPRQFLCLLLLDALQSLFPLASAWITKLLFDVLAKGLQGQVFSWNEVGGLLAIQAALTIISHLLQPATTYMNAEINRHLSIKVQMTIFDKLNSLAGLSPFEDPKIRDMIQMGAQGGQMGPSQALNTLTSLLRNTITLLSFLGVLTVFNTLLSSLVMLAALPQIYVHVKMGRQRFVIAEENLSKQRQAGYYSGVLSATQIVKELRLFNLGEFFLNRFRHLTEELNQIQRIQQKRELGWKFWLNMITTLVSSATFIVVVIQALQDRLSLGDVTLFSSAVSRVQSALAGIVLALTNVQESSLFFSRYNDLLALPQPIYISSSPCSTPPLASAIELCNVSFRYSDEHPWVLREINLTIPAGQCLALVGLNGAGKTTLVKLLTRMYDPCEGKILWDKIDIREFDPVVLRNHIGAIFQDFVHFDMTALENIVFGNVTKLNNGGYHKAEELARQAATKVGIHETIHALPKGYHTTLSRWLVDQGDGVDLSGGEWQKIALARLFVRDADFLILDEPTSALDAQAEHDVYNRFVELVKGRTSLLISHRFSTVRMADLIAVLDGGRITEFGSHHELMNLGGAYARLYKMQAERYR